MQKPPSKSEVQRWGKQKVGYSGPNNQNNSYNYLSLFGSKLIDFGEIMKDIKMLIFAGDLICFSLVTFHQLYIEPTDISFVRLVFCFTLYYMALSLKINSNHNVLVRSSKSVTNV